MKSTPIVPSDTDGLTYRIGESGDVVRFDQSALQTFANYRQRHWWQTEAGGQLFAEFNELGSRVVTATEPTRWDQRFRRGFRPHRPSEQGAIDAHFHQGLHFIGDWHTHAEHYPLPSAEDVTSINECVRLSKHQLNGFLLVIVGQADFPQGLFVGFADGYQVHRLSPHA